MDQDAVNLAKAIRERESGGNFKAVGDAGTSKGGYQWQAGTWKEHAKKTLGDENAPMTPENQNAVAYKMIKTWKDQGKTPAQIAAKWNSGQFDNWENKRGHNKKLGLDYDVPAYVKAVTDNYQRIKAESSGTAYASESEVVAEKPKKTLLEKTSNTLDTIFGGGKIGGLIGNLIAKNSQSGKELATQEQQGMIPEGTTAETFKGPSAMQVGGDVLKVASTFIPVGRVAGGVEKVAAKVLPKTAAKFAGNVGAGAGTGYALDVAENLRNESETPFKAGMGTGVGATIPMLSPFLKGANFLRKEALGLSTGVGGKAIGAFESAIAKGGEASKAATQAMRGKIPAEQIVNEASDALDSYVKNRSTEYTKSLETLKTSTKQFDKKPVVEKFNKMLDDFGVTFKQDGTPDFTRSPGLGRYEKDLRGISEVLADWGSQQGDNTLVGMDKLKQVINDFRIGSADSKKFDSFVQALKTNVKDMLKNEPGYLDMLKNYETSTEVIQDIRKSLSLNDKASTDTAFKKLMSVLKTNQDVREQLVRELDDFSGGTLIPKIAGQQLAETMPRGLIGKLAVGGGAIGLTGGAGLLPVLSYLLFASPRFIGETSRILGLGARGAEVLKKLLMLSGVDRSNISPGDVIMNKLEKKPAYQTSPMLKLIDDAKKKSATMDIVK